MIQEQGAMNSQVLDSMLPGLIDDLEALGKLSRTFRMGIAQPMGSITGAVQVRQAAIAGTIGAITATLTNPDAIAPKALGALGIGYLLRRVARSALAGQLGQMQSRMLLEGPQGMFRLPGAGGRLEQKIMPGGALGQETMQ